MKIAKYVGLGVAISFALAGLLMEIFDIKIDGEFLAYRAGWVQNTITGKWMLVFALVFILLRQFLIWYKKK